jgi:hypothetical protein
MAKESHIYNNYKISNEELFKYTIIVILTIFYFSTKIIKLNILYGTLIALIIIYYLFNKNKELHDDNNKIIQEKKSIIYPESKFMNNYDDLVDFVYNIQDFYIYNPEVYQKMIKYIDIFLMLYEEVNVNNSIAALNYNMMLTNKHLALDSLHSIIYKLPVNRTYTDKFNLALSELSNILNKYMEDIEKISKEYLHENGYNTRTILLQKGVLPSNTFDEKYIHILS